MPAPKNPIKRAEWIKKFSDKLRGKPKSEEHRRKISEAHLGKIVSNKIRKKMSKAHTGIPLSEEHRRGVSEGQRGKVLSEEHKRKISETQTKISAHISFDYDNRGTSLPSGFIFTLCWTIIGRGLPFHRWLIIFLEQFALSSLQAKV